MDLCLPHLSILFGFMEDETDVVFIKMGLLSFTNNNERQKMTMVVKKVWEDLKGKFKIQNLIEVSPLRLNGIATNVFFIKLGHCLLNPPKIWKKLQSPYKLITCKTSFFLSHILISVLKNTKLFSILIKISYYFSFSSKHYSINTNWEEKYDDNLESNEVKIILKQLLKKN